nr:WPP domain-interacting tail-anchored protein 1-like [Tanacetum cinerariifolium]
MNRGVSSGGGQSSLNYLFGGGETPKPALKATQAAPCETPAANNVSAAKPDLVSPPIDVTKQIPAVSELSSLLYCKDGYHHQLYASSQTSSLHSSGTSSISIKTSRDSESIGEIIARFEPDIAFICKRVFGSEVRLLETLIVETSLENFYEAYHSSELLMESSNEVLSRIKMLHFNLKGSVHREAEFKSNLLKLQLANEKACIQVEAFYEASLEDKSMLQFTIKDMENVIEDLKSKVTRAEGQTDSVEDKCIILSEANDDLKKELSFVKGRVKFLETSLHQMEEAKKASTKDIKALSSNSEVEMASNETVMDSTEADSRDEAFKQREAAVKEVGILRGELQQASMLEIYNENIYASSRSVGRTDMNEESSQSHTVFILRIYGVNEEGLRRTIESYSDLRAGVYLKKKVSKVMQSLVLSRILWNGEVLLMGDFNEVRLEEERYGSIFNSGGAAAFNSFIVDSGWWKYLLVVSFLHGHIDGFDSFISDTWCNINIIEPNAMFKITKKLKILKGHIRMWVKDKRASASNLKKDLKNKLSNIDSLIDKGKVSLAILEGRLDTMNKLASLENMESSELAQKSKVKWSIEGDENSKIFHGGNSSFIALILKTQGAKLVKDFRMISLIGSLYKIITKLLANRLVTVIVIL